MAIMQRPDQDKNSIAFMQGQIQAARGTLLGMIILTVVNAVLLLTESDYYMLYSISMTYVLMVFGQVMDGAVFGTYTVTALVISAGIVAVFLACWILSKKKHIWLTVALVLTIVDCVLMLVFTFAVMENPAENLVQIFVTLFLVYLLFRGVWNAKRLRTAQAEAQSASPEIP